MTHECNLTKRLREAGDRKIRKFPTRRRNMLSWEFREEGFRLLVLVLVFSFRSHSLSNLLLEFTELAHGFSKLSVLQRKRNSCVCVSVVCFEKSRFHLALAFLRGKVKSEFVLAGIQNQTKRLIIWLYFIAAAKIRENKIKLNFKICVWIYT